MVFAISLLLKCVVITLFIDAWLYFAHRAFHSKHAPNWLKRIHYQHHASFHKTEVFSLNPVELLLEAIPAFAFVWWITDWWWFFPAIVLPWGLFEAARGHGHFKWFKLIPRWYYKTFRFCGQRYHLAHHAPGGEHGNLGQMLRIWDDICGTRLPRQG